MELLAFLLVFTVWSGLLYVIALPFLALHKYLKGK